MARVTTSMRGPGMMPCSIACLMPTSELPAPSVPRSRIVVKPAISVLRAWTTARAVRTASGSANTWTFQGVSLYGCRKTCVWASISPGRRVIPGRLIVAAPAGAELSAPGPAATMEFPCTTTVHPWWSSVPSNTAAGRRMVGVVGACVMLGWDGRPDVRADCAKAAGGAAAMTAAVNIAVNTAACTAVNTAVNTAVTTVTSADASAVSGVVAGHAEAPSAGGCWAVRRILVGVEVSGRLVPGARRVSYGHCCGSRAARGVAAAGCLGAHSSRVNDGPGGGSRVEGMSHGLEPTGAWTYVSRSVSRTASSRAAFRRAAIRLRARVFPDLKHADHQSARPAEPPRRSQEGEGARAEVEPAEAGRVHARLHDYSEEAQLGAA